MTNNLSRIIFGILYGVVLTFGIIWDRTIFGVLFLMILYFGMNEFYTITLHQRMKLQQKLGIFAGVALYACIASHMFWGTDVTYAVICVLPLLLIPIVTVLIGDIDSMEDLGLVYSGILYVAAPISMFPLLVMDGDVFDGWLLLSLFIIIWFSDSGAYFIGSRFGQGENSRKLAPAISPKKSWAGFWGGTVCSVAIAYVLHLLHWLPFSLVHSLIIGIIVSLAGVAGDLFESMWKRHFNVKDSGNLIPGHGGMLDRIDSALIAIPTACIYLIVANLI